jgi:WD40 repeat protein
MKTNFIYILSCTIIFCFATSAIANETLPFLEIKTNEILSTFDYDPDGTKIATGGKSHDISIWDIDQKRTLLTLKGHTDDVVTLRYSANGRLIASSGMDRQLIVWDAIAGTIITSIKAEKSYVRDVVFSPDNKYLASANWENSTVIWNALTGKKIVTLGGHTDNITAVAFNKEGTILATGSADKSVKLWETDTWKEILTLRGHNNDIKAVNFSNNGKYIISSSLDNTTRIWETETGKESVNIITHSSGNTSACFSPNDQLIATSGGDKKLKIWDLSTNELAFQAADNLFLTSVEAVRFSPDGKNFAAISQDGYLRVFNTPSLRTRREVYTQDKLQNWKQKKEFESYAELEKRMLETPYVAQKFDSLFNEKILYFFEKNTKWAKISLKKYNPDEEIYSITSPILGDLYLRIPPAEAEKFKLNFDKAVIRKPTYTVGLDAVILDFVEINIPIGDDIKGYLLLTKI